MPGSLYVVSTPIGNLEDITLRALKVLKAVRLIACEDTRRTRKLLSFYKIGTPCTSYFEGNKFKKGEYLVSRLKGGDCVALVTDAGTPGISDPGHHLVEQAVANGIAVSPVPGPSAITAALAVSGIREHRFYFRGFLPTKGRKRALALLKGVEGTLIFYESPRRLVSSLGDILQVLGNRRVVIAREMTKLFEEVVRGRVAEVVEKLGDLPVKGEVTLLVAEADREEL